MLIKKINEQNAPLLLKLAKSCPPLDVHTPYTYWVMANFFSDDSFIIYDNDLPVGYIMGFCKEEIAFIWQIGVIRTHQKKGLSSLLIDAFISNALKKNIYRVYTTIAPDNSSSRGTFFSLTPKNTILKFLKNAPSMSKMMFSTPSKSNLSSKSLFNCFFPLTKKESRLSCLLFLLFKLFIPDSTLRIWRLSAGNLILKSAS